MIPLRDEIHDMVIELVFCSFPGLSDDEFRCFVHKMLRIVDYAVIELLKNERHVRYIKSLNRSRN